MLQVKTSTLFAIAGVFWFIAGLNVTIIGVAAYYVVNGAPWHYAFLGAGTLAVFLLFFLRIFKPYAAKHAERIDDMTEEYVSAFKFMDVKGYLMIIIMISLGVALRLSSFVPNWFIAFFYVGLGVALALTGGLFLIDWRQRV